MRSVFAKSQNPRLAKCSPVLWFFRKGRRIVAVHGIRNKALAIPASQVAVETRDLATAQNRMRDWQDRFEK